MKNQVTKKNNEVEASVTISKAKFTASDLKNDLYALAKASQAKNANPRQFNAAIGAYRAILSTISLEMKAAKLGVSISGK